MNAGLDLDIFFRQTQLSSLRMHIQLKSASMRNASLMYSLKKKVR